MSVRLVWDDAFAGKSSESREGPSRLADLRHAEFEPAPSRRPFMSEKRIEPANAPSEATGKEPRL
jgi:hypothetical protein